jgi:hypothetical protein
MSIVTFRCKRSGNLVSFTNENDIEGLRAHEGYTEVIDAETTKTIQGESKETSPKEVLRRGRPPKVGVPQFLQE